mmetsp:Transcript_14553/g.39395  ORF Transcript_14553/g.39395 Transcript_14553/m.39395 type:complete len:236 (+) Transcript_14553:1837-2544(+)
MLPRRRYASTVEGATTLSASLPVPTDAPGAPTCWRSCSTARMPVLLCAGRVPSELQWKPPSSAATRPPGTPCAATTMNTLPSGFSATRGGRLEGTVSTGSCCTSTSTAVQGCGGCESCCSWCCCKLSLRWGGRELCCCGCCTSASSRGCRSSCCCCCCVLPPVHNACTMPTNGGPCSRCCCAAMPAGPGTPAADAMATSRERGTGEAPCVHESGCGSGGWCVWGEEEVSARESGL